MEKRNQIKFKMLYTREIREVSIKHIESKKTFARYHKKED